MTDTVTIIVPPVERTLIVPAVQRVVFVPARK